MDVIALHRVVKEDQPNQPIRTKKTIFLTGTLSATTPDDFGAAVYWARHDVDIWGIDQAWNLVPAETADPGFMADWGVDKQVRDLGDAVKIARLARRNWFGSPSWIGSKITPAVAVTRKNSPRKYNFVCGWPGYPLG